MNVTRVELAEIFRPVMDGTVRSADELVSVAVAAGAHPDAVEVVRSLPPGEYRRMTDLWRHLPGVPVGV
ncbi:DUF2795 domain-containing protein [Georgenia daeguensis]|uniref:DUF2795 domain-containing protein n=1 Tax=Georgenia daeguensis TaxID=908355 RepID=A0ABP8EZ51_9MICO